ncbi:methionyl-tRNA formyltransferase [Proteobacteria bacterium 005FR1]|nr:methionyl-tRNA formyltransferase [Proteobacteria bacterium 005FR1]
MQESAGLRIVFAGTPEFAADYLSALLNSPHQLIAVYTQPDRPAGRGKKLSPSPVKKLALEHGLPVHQPASLRREEAQQELAALEADVMVVVAYGLILPQAVLDLPRLGCLNVHASLLPRWRGAAPIQRAIEAGDRETGVTIMQMDAGLDSGVMLATAACPIEPSDTAATLLQGLASLGKDPLLEALNQLAAGTAQPVPQDDSLATYASKIDKAEAAIDWALDARAIDRKIRAFNPFPVAFSQLDDQRVKVYRAKPSDLSGGGSPLPGTILSLDGRGIMVQCGRGSLQIEELQLPGKRPMTAKEVLLGNRALFAVGARFQSTP